MIKVECSKLQNEQNKCLICGKPVHTKNGLQCHNQCKHYVHYMCLGCDDKKINDIKSGIIAVLCSCKKCLFDSEDVEYEDANEGCDECNGCDIIDCCDKPQNIPPGVCLQKDPPASPKKCSAKSQNTSIPCKICGAYTPDDGNRCEDVPEKKACTCSKGVLTIDIECEAEEKHVVRIPIISSCNIANPDCREYTIEKSCQHIDATPNHRKKIAKCSHPSENEPVCQKPLDKEVKGPTSCSENQVEKPAPDSFCVKPSESPECVRPKVADQSMIDVLESVCHTVKQLHNQLRHLVCRMVTKEQPKCKSN